MLSKTIICTTIVCIFVCTGCTGVSVRKVSSPCQEGIRYYRPKPYLFVTGKPIPSDTDAPTFTLDQQSPVKTSAALFTPQDFFRRVSFDQNDNMMTGPETSDEMRTTPPADPPILEISMQLQYLPDFAEEYAIEYKPGLGIGELNVTLENGWNLTSLGVKTDQQTDEIIGSVASLIGSVSAAAVPPSAPDEANIYGTNVPFGYYEAVIATDSCGKKTLYGWRYVGFMPFQACPLEANGSESFCCNPDAIYGLVHVNGILQFEQIATIPKFPVKPNGK